MESTIYHLYASGPEGLNYSIYPAYADDSRMAKILKKASVYTFLAGVLILGIFWAPEAVQSAASGKMISGLLFNTASKADQTVVHTVQKDVYQPKFDPKLPLESRLKINSIGVDTNLTEATLPNYEDALRKGVWRVSDFGSPADRTKPTILVAHRYGYLAWTNIFRRKNSFYNLPKLEVGDTVEIIWKQRKYTYEVYAEGEGEEITDYQANLILYTCENLNSPVRVFKYARLLEI